MPTPGLFASPLILPNINTNNVITITNAPYNAVGDGATDNTLAISNAIVQAAKGGNTNNLFGGTVKIPAPGVFLCGPLTFKNNVNIQIDGGAILRMLPLNLFTNYPSNGGDTYGNLFYASGLTNLEISGSGAIDGQGSPWWSAATGGDGTNAAQRSTSDGEHLCGCLVVFAAGCGGKTDRAHRNQ